MNENECSELCAPAIAIQFMAGVELGSCVDLGFIGNPKTQTVLPPGSPSDVEVRVTSLADAETTVAADMEEPKSTCHCHSYEEIVCPEAETAEDTLYIEHIEEINEHCQGILDGSETDCPYKCFQPMEVLHLHYLECPSRPIDPTYVAVNATNMCHIAAAAPEGRTGDQCPVVDLAFKPSVKEPSVAGINEEEASSVPLGAMVGAVVGAAFLCLGVGLGVGYYVGVYIVKPRQDDADYEKGDNYEKGDTSHEVSTRMGGQSTDLP